jgi:hypothetical protein
LILSQEQEQRPGTHGTERRRQQDSVGVYHQWCVQQRANRGFGIDISGTEK